MTIHPSASGAPAHVVRLGVRVARAVRRRRRGAAPAAGVAYGARRETGRGTLPRHGHRRPARRASREGGPGWSDADDDPPAGRRRRTGPDREDADRRRGVGRDAGLGTPVRAAGAPARPRQLRVRGLATARRRHAVRDRPGLPRRPVPAQRGAAVPPARWSRRRRGPSPSSSRCAHPSAEQPLVHLFGSLEGGDGGPVPNRTGELVARRVSVFNRPGRIARRNGYLGR